ncbi:MAG: hypothetical protein QN152_03555 [Armatimonadota bacterium]|nr:hypothetical protein [Armatimonadota bacterium]MDR7427025.1 hypothetical protein [Armatimonadota bacterium]MDR7465294.1 hypothetical protein [Armatimonadota bacterium]MDR7468763.1 hypothetical protein [Armatimonadota bacterium]MDR7473716.1 hypothetical protein [Armatimonadota bacterium]
MAIRVAGAALLALTVACSESVVWGSGATGPAGPQRVVVIPRQYRVWFVPTASPSAAAAVLLGLGLHIVRADEAGRVYVIRIPQGVEEAKVLRSLRQSHLVLCVAPDVVVVQARKPVGPPPPKHPQP